MATEDDVVSNDNDYKKNIEILEQHVEKLYRLRDYYFEDNPLDRAAERIEDIESALAEALKKFDEFKDSIGDERGTYYYLKGKALNVLANYNEEAETMLSKAIKLNHKTTDTWNTLGEVFCKVNKFTQARICFNNAMKLEKNVISLQNLSILTRQDESIIKERQKQNILSGMQYAKEAVQMDPQNGTSWSVLGNAHLYCYFFISQNPITLKQSISAYNQAEKDVIARFNPDLHYNKGITYKYEENYEAALKSFNQSFALDPKWNAPIAKEKELVYYLDNIMDTVNAASKLKGKKKIQRTSFSSHLLGPYKDETHIPLSKQHIKLDEIDLSELRPGLNSEKVVLVKVLSHIHNDDSVPSTFSIIDKTGLIIPLTLYNVARGKGVKINDAVAIPEPYVNRTDFSYKDRHYNFQSIRVDSPLVLVVNGKRNNPIEQVNIEMSVEKRFT